MANWSVKKYRALAKGFIGRAKNTPKAMFNRVQKSFQYSYIGRKMRPRIFRKEWIQSINAAVREHKINYSKFIFGLNHSNIYLDRKILSDLAQYEPFSFKAVVDEIKIQAKLQEQPKQLVTLDEAYERGYIANQITQSWYKQGVHENYKTMGLRRPMTPEEIEKFQKGG